MSEDIIRALNESLGNVPPPCGGLTAREQHGIESQSAREGCKCDWCKPPKPRRTAREQQIEGDHYKKLPIQPFDYSMQNGLDPLQHTIIKYVTRFRDKDGIADLRKAIHCVQLLIEFEEGKANVG